jgi:hypothetical protein
LIPVHAKGLRPGASNRSRLGIRSEPDTGGITRLLIPNGISIRTCTGTSRIVHNN